MGLEHCPGTIAGKLPKLPSIPICVLLFQS
jgi:hypothetical protein